MRSWFGTVLWGFRCCFEPGCARGGVDGARGWWRRGFFVSVGHNSRVPYVESLGGAKNLWWVHSADSRISLSFLADNSIRGAVRSEARASLTGRCPTTLDNC